MKRGYLPILLLQEDHPVGGVQAREIKAIKSGSDSDETHISGVRCKKKDGF